MARINPLLPGLVGSRAWERAATSSFVVCSPCKNAGPPPLFRVQMSRHHCWSLVAALLSVMSFSYGFGSNPAIDYPRLLIYDIVDSGHIFEDSEISAATAIETGAFQSSQFYSGASGANLPAAPVPYRRIAATLLDALAANKSRLGSAIQILDVKVDLGKVAISIRDQAKALRQADEDAGSFSIIEQVTDAFSQRDRFWKQVQRQSA